MLYGILADAVMVAHLGFILFIIIGGLLAVRWPWLAWAHVPALAWAAGTVTIGFTCPLTSLELGLRRLAGEQGYDGGYVDHYLEDVIYPERYTTVLRALAAVGVVASYVTLYRRVSGRGTKPDQRVLAAVRSESRSMASTRSSSGGGAGAVSSSSCKSRSSVHEPDGPVGADSHVSHMSVSPWEPATWWSRICGGSARTTSVMPGHSRSTRHSTAP